MHRYLTQHPDFLEPLVPKNVHFFDHNFERGVEWYEHHFPPAGAARRHEAATGIAARTGETCPYYLYHPLVADRIASTYPAVKIVILLRNPVIRAWSHHRYEVARGAETLDFDHALDAEQSRLGDIEQRLTEDPSLRSEAHQAWSYFDRGLYLKQLRRFEEVFAPDQLLVICSEDFFTDPVASLIKVQEFVGLSAHRPADLRVGKANTKSDTPDGLVELAARYEPHNQELFAHLGRRFDW